MATPKAGSSSQNNTTQSTKASQTQNESQETEWDVLEILEERQRGSRTEYRVKWDGLDDQGNEWDPSWVKSTDCSAELIQTWQAKKDRLGLESPADRGKKKVKEREDRKRRRESDMAESAKKQRAGTPPKRSLRSTASVSQSPATNVMLDSRRKKEIIRSTDSPLAEQPVKQSGQASSPKSPERSEKKTNGPTGDFTDRHPGDEHVDSSNEPSSTRHSVIVTQSSNLTSQPHVSFDPIDLFSSPPSGGENGLMATEQPNDTSGDLNGRELEAETLPPGFNWQEVDGERVMVAVEGLESEVIVQESHDSVHLTGKEGPASMNDVDGEMQETLDMNLARQLAREMDAYLDGEDDLDVLREDVREGEVQTTTDTQVEKHVQTDPISPTPPVSEQIPETSFLCPFEGCDTHLHSMPLVLEHVTAHLATPLAPTSKASDDPPIDPGSTSSSSTNNATVLPNSKSDLQHPSPSAPQISNDETPFDTPPHDTTTETALAQKDLLERISSLETTIKSNVRFISSLESQMSYLQTAYQQASTTAVSSVSQITELEDQISKLREQLTIGLKQRDIFFQSIRLRVERENQQLKGQIKILLDQSRLTDDVIRRRAVDYPRVVKELQESRKKCEEMEDRMGRVEKRNEELIDRLQVIRAYKMGVLPIPPEGVEGLDEDEDDSGSEFEGEDGDGEGKGRMRETVDVDTFMVNGMGRSSMDGVVGSNKIHNLSNNSDARQEDDENLGNFKQLQIQKVIHEDPDGVDIVQEVISLQERFTMMKES
ncbi:hypothetical protein M231_01907 [Tremella mesenterica]|uniref:Chromo domain-containing protein n=1 Tax=Tremella mesenterica TaxID=5217 RepID=A0A4Q1BSC9_TREME|nr:hypothetical protein M231_01907 [Tremella mesenterica]